MFKRINHRNNHNHNDTFLYTFFIHHRNKVNKTERWVFSIKFLIVKLSCYFLSYQVIAIVAKYIWGLWEEKLLLLDRNQAITEGRAPSTDKTMLA